MSVKLGTMYCLNSMYEEYFEENHDSRRVVNKFITTKFVKIIILRRKKLINSLILRRKKKR